MSRPKVKVKIVVSPMNWNKYDSRIMDLRDIRGGADTFASEITKVRLGCDRPLFFQITPSFFKRYEVQKVLEHKADEVEIIYWHCSD